MPKENLASSIRVRCSVCRRLLEAGAEDLQLEGRITQENNYYFYIKCPACHARVIIPPESWPLGETSELQ